MRFAIERMSGVALCLCALAGLPGPALAAADSDRFRAIYEKEWAFRLQEFPQFASYVGVHDYSDRMGRVAEQDQALRLAFWKGIRAELDGVSCARLERAECIHYRIFVAQMDKFIAAYETQSHLIPFNSDSGFYSDWVRLPEETEFGSADDYRDYLARLHELPAGLRVCQLPGAAIHHAPALLSSRCRPDSQFFVTWKFRRYFSTRRRDFPRIGCVLRGW